MPLRARTGGALLFRFGGDVHFPWTASESLLHGAPGKHGAFNALREFLNALEELKIAEAFRFGGGLARDEILEGVGERGGFSARLALQLHGHHRGRGLADGATLAAEFYFFQFAVGTEVDAEMDFIAASGVVAMDENVGVRKRAEVSGAPGMIEDHFLIKLFEFRAHAKKRAASPRISIMRSISAVVL